MSSFERSADISPQHRGSATTLDETLSINDGGDWTRVHPEHYSYENKEMWIERSVLKRFKQQVLINSNVIALKLGAKHCATAKY